MDSFLLLCFVRCEEKSRRNAQIYLSNYILQQQQSTLCSEWFCLFLQFTIITRIKIKQKKLGIRTELICPRTTQPISTVHTTLHRAHIFRFNSAYHALVYRHRHSTNVLTYYRVDSLKRNAMAFTAKRKHTHRPTRRQSR